MGSQEYKSPQLMKVIIGAAAFLLLFPMMLFAALPNLFFGYGGAGPDAMVLGGVCTSLEDFNRTYVDSIVTGIVSDYENAGTAIDRVEVSNDMEEDDFLWLTAISAAANQQKISGGDLRSLCETCLPVTHSLVSETGEGGAVITTLKVEIQKPDPEAIMDSLGFGEEAKDWAEAMFELPRDGGALEKYASFLEAYRPNYEGDTSQGGGIEHGGSYGSSIDISHTAPTECRTTARTRCISPPQSKALCPPCLKSRAWPSGNPDISASTSETAMSSRPWAPNTASYGQR